MRKALWRAWLRWRARAAVHAGFRSLKRSSLEAAANADIVKTGWWEIYIGKAALERCQGTQRQASGHQTTRKTGQRRGGDLVGGGGRGGVTEKIIHAHKPC